MSILSDKSDKSHKYETLNMNKYASGSPPLSRATSPLNHDNEAGVKVGAKVCLTAPLPALPLSPSVRLAG